MSSGFQAGKNVITVGAVNSSGAYTGPGSVPQSTYGSWGPTRDGRIAPLVVSPGGEASNPVTSANAGATNSYITYYGTSMAAPQVTAIVGSWCGRWDQLCSTPCLSSTAKALAAHTARPASTVAGPNYRSGFGLISADGGIRLVSSNYIGSVAAWNLPFIKEMELWTNRPVEFPITIPAGSTGRVTIAWSDPPGVVRSRTNVTAYPGPGSTPVYLASPSLVNDLDLQVVRIGGAGETNLPWVLNPTNYTAAATRGDNRLDNVEMVDIVGTGTFMVKVTCKTTPVNGQGQPAPQSFSMVLSGHTPAPAPELRITQHEYINVSATNWLFGLSLDCVPGARITVQQAGSVTGPWQNVVSDAIATQTNMSFSIPVGTAENAFFRLSRSR